MADTKEIPLQPSLVLADIKKRMDRVEKMLILAIATNAPNLIRAIQIWLGL